MDESVAIDVEDCRRCPALVASRRRIVNGVGPADADLLFVGEAPGEQEDRDGEPFVGRSGELLSETLAEHGLDRDTVRITNSVKCRPPENRDPTGTELANCRDHLEREIRGVDPVAIVTLGKVPSEHLLGRSVAVTAAAGTTETLVVGDSTYRVLIGLHPAATLYDPSTRESFEAVIAEAAAMLRPEQ
ncbi:MAG: uracil-DNA glycosylase [Halodesulfurarchaeum sp.]|nr:uracil-DNA glycosylase [Halodesulfurarchaeum sp.]